MEAQRNLFSASHRRPDVNERQPHAATVAGATHGRFRCAHRTSQSQLLSELPVDGSRSRANTRNAVGADDFADRSRRRIVATAGRIAPGEILGTTCPLIATYRQSELRSGKIYIVVVGIHPTGYDFGGSPEPGGKTASRCVRNSSTMGFSSNYVECGNCGSGSKIGFRE